MTARLRSVTGRVRTVGHRGAQADAPENTVAAFRAALTAGVDEIEFDVQLTSDGVPVVLHDATLDRTTDGHGPLRDHTWAEIERLDAGGWSAPEHAGERVPSLEQLCAWVTDKPLDLALEVKQPAPGEGLARDERLVPAILAVLRAHGLVERTVIHSFDHPSIAQVLVLEPRAATALLCSGPLFAEYLDGAITIPGIAGLHIRWPWVSRELCSAAHARGLYVHAWGLPEPPLSGDLVRRLVTFGVDSLSANAPRDLVAMVRAT
jgi:glycerophosphoryl diester phosphodiesterase